MKPYDINYDTKTGVFNTSSHGQAVMNATTETNIAASSDNDGNPTD